MRCDHEVLSVSGHFGALNIPIQHLAQALAHAGQKVFLLEHAPTKHDAPWRKDQRERGERRREVTRFQLPNRVIYWRTLGVTAEPS